MKPEIAWMFEDRCYGLWVSTASDTRDQCWEEAWRVFGGQRAWNWLRRRKSRNARLFEHYKDRAFRDFVRRHRGRPVKVVVTKLEEK